MILRHSAALAFVGWYLMVPPTGRDYPMGNACQPVDTHTAVDKRRLTHGQLTRPKVLKHCYSSGQPCEPFILAFARIRFWEATGERRRDSRQGRFSRSTPR
jgi:hypothetical protein